LRIFKKYKIIRTVIVLCFVSFWFTSTGQVKNKYSLTCIVIDSVSKQPIEYASIAIYKQLDNALVTGTVTNPKGQFAFKDLPPAKYLVKCSFVGYKVKTVQIEISNASLNLSEPIALANSSTNLSEVQITEKQNEKQVNIEKTKIDVSQNISSVSGNVLDVLKSQPSITIDAENKVYLRGNSNILILIDGRPTTVTSLNSIPSSSIDNIEIITNPDAKYDAEGTGGIINIITKKQSTSGFNGSITVNYGINNRINGGISLNYSKGIWDIGLSYSGRYEKTNINSNLTRQLYSPSMLIEQDIHSVQTTPSHNAALLLSVKPNGKNIITLGAKAIFPDIFNKQNISGRQFSDTLPVVLFNRINDTKWSRKTFEGSLSYKRIFVRNKNELSFDALFSRTKGSRPANYYINDEFLQKSEAGGAPTNITLQVDYLKQVSKKGKIECGLKGFSRWNNFISHFYDWDTLSNQWLINAAYSNDLEHKEYIYSAYLMYSDSLFKKMFYKIGARVEYTTSELVQNSTNENLYKTYLFPFPFLLVKYNINASNNIALGVTRRVTRPTYPQLNPIIMVIDQMTYEIGNKNVKPEITDKIELNHSWIKEKYQVRTNLFFSTSKDFITQVSLLSSADKLIVTYVNGNRLYKTGLDFDATIKFNKIISINPGFSVFYAASSGTYNEIDLNTNNIAWTGTFKATIKPEKKTELQLFINYNSPIALPQFDLKEIYYADVAIKRSFIKDRLSLSFTVTDVFNTRKWVINSDNNIYRLHNESKNDTRVFWFGIVYNINAFKPSKTQKNDNTDNDNGIIKLGQ
jgi:outer membrane receptor for ferrienterochelin and colicin